VAQRVVRAKHRLRREEARFEVPEADELGGRLEAILDVLYIVFGEGHTPSESDAAIESELCDEALRLARLLVESPRTATTTTEALLSLFCFQASRTAARRADDGSLLLLSEQDRTRWDQALVADGFLHLDRAARGGSLSRFHLEAGIAACHSVAPGHHATDWPQIVALYDAFRALAPSPIVEVNRAVAVAMVSGALAGIDELDAIPERELVDRYPYALAAYAELFASMGRIDEARAYLARALAQQPARAQRMLLERKLAALR
jgi:RNA polymerase sigma-70 factor (ECF subfamily)